MVQMMERHGELDPEDCFCESVNLASRLIIANARNPTV